MAARSSRSPGAPGGRAAAASRRPEPVGAIADDGALFEDLHGEPVLEGPDLDTEWLYSQDDQVFGPITTRQLLQRLYEGALSAETPVALEGGDFQAIRRIGAFRAHLPKVEQHQAEVAEARALAVAEARRRLVRRTKWFALGLAVAVGGSAATVAVVRTQRAARAEAERSAKEAALQEDLDRLMASVTIEPPLESLLGEDAPPRGRRRRRPKSARVPSGGARGILTRREIVRGMNRAFGGFKRCIVRQIQRSPSSVGAQIVLTFTIANDGRARNVSIRDRFLRASPMRACFEKKLAALRWRTFKGEVRNVDYPISVRR